VSDYDAFVASKLSRVPPTGMRDVPELTPDMFPFQRDLVTWALRRGRCAIFADTGLGKTRMQVEWAHRVNIHTGRPVLILAPLAVARQTAREGDAIGVRVSVCRDQFATTDGVNITNYDRLHKFDPSAFGAVVLDESSIIKHHTAKTLQILLDAFSSTPFRLACTATPSPNDYTELGTHAEFLGICTREEMLAEFFCHDGGETQKWRLKGHAREAFWRWVATWGAMLRRPSDLGYEGAGYDLPPLVVTHHTLPADPDTVRASGYLFAMPAGDLTERRIARRASLSARVAAVVRDVTECTCQSRSPPQCTCGASETWVIWVDLNDESDELHAAIPGSVEIRGNLDVDEKERRLVAFAEGKTRVLVSKASMTGFGLNWQHCARMAFVGVTDSWEAYYQAVRRCYRFGQKRAVHVHIYASEVEGSVVANLQRKEKDAQKMAEELTAETRAALLEEIRGSVRTTNAYGAREIVMPEWLRSEVA
jgi:superfamily II DNA or RNA helicase